MTRIIAESVASKRVHDMDQPPVGHMSSIFRRAVGTASKTIEKNDFMILRKLGRQALKKHGLTEPALSMDKLRFVQTTNTVERIRKLLALNNFADLGKLKGAR